MSSVYISDVLDLVAATVEVNCWEADYGPPEPVLSITITHPGVGCNDAREWLARALFLLAEEVSTTAPESKGAAAVIGGSHTISETGDGGI